MKMLIDFTIAIVLMNSVFIGSCLIADGAEDGPTAKVFVGINIIVIAIFGAIILGERNDFNFRNGICNHSYFNC